MPPLLSATACRKRGDHELPANKKLTLHEPHYTNPSESTKQESTLPVDYTKKGRWNQWQKRNWLNTM